MTADRVKKALDAYDATIGGIYRDADWTANAAAELAEAVREQIEEERMVEAAEG